MDDIELITVSELIDKLITVNIKLYNLMDEIAEYSTRDKLSDKAPGRLLELNSDQILLVRQRSQLRSAIDIKINDAIQKGKTNTLNEVKNYGK